MPDFAEKPANEIGRRLEIRGTHAWLVLVRPAEAHEEALEDLRTELSVMLERPVRIVDAGRVSITELRQDIRTPPDDIVLLTGLDGFDEASWAALDLNRSGLERPGAIIMWLSSSAVLTLSRHASSVRSFVGGSFFALGPQGGIMSGEERDRRLNELAEHFQLSSEHVLGMAQAGQLPPDPLFVEWLVLLGRGDLV